MKLAELKTKTPDQLDDLMHDFKKELMNLRFQLVSGTITNTARIGQVRKMIAKIQTLLNNMQPKNRGVRKNA